MGWQDDEIIEPAGTGVDVPVQRSMRVSPADQLQRDRASLAIKQQEVRQYPNDSDLRQDILNSQKRVGVAKQNWQDDPIEQPAAQPAAKATPYQPYQNETDIGSDTERFGENPGTGKGGAEFHQGIASTPARLVKSIAQLTSQERHLPKVVHQSAEVADTGYGTAGRLVGDVAATAFPAARLAKATAGMKVLPRVAAVSAENAGYGAALSPDEQGRSAAFGAVAGPIAMGLGRVVGGLVKPTDDARVLMDKGVALTPGQAAGTASLASRAEQWAASNPVASHFVRGAQRRGVEESNIAAVQAVTDMVDKSVKLGMPVADAIEQTRHLIGKTYDKALEGLEVGSNDVIQPLNYKLLKLPTDFPMVEKHQLDQMQRYINQRIKGVVDNSGGTLNGANLKQLDSEIGSHIRNLRSSTTAADKTAAPAWAELQQHIRDVMEVAQNDPDKVAALKAANAAYRHLLALEKARLPGNATFTPRRLVATLEKANGGQLPNNELGKVAGAMQRTLPNSVPDSGTAERLLAVGLPSMLVGGGAGAQSMGWDTVGTGMMAAGALGSRTGSRLMTGASRIPFTGGMNWQPSAEAAIRALRRGVRPPGDKND